MAARSGGAAKKPAIPQPAWHSVTPAPVVLVSGPESLLAERAIRSIREQMRSADPSLEVSDIDAGQYAPGELLTLASPSLFAEPRLIRVDQVEKCTDAFLEETLAYLAEPADDTVLVLRHGGGVRGKKLLDAIRGGLGSGVEVVCAELKRESDKVDFAAAEFRAAGRKATPGAVRALVSAFSDDLAELAAACRQLVSDTDGDITEAVVDRYYEGRAEVTAFAVADAAIAGRLGESLGLMRHALASGSDPVPMVAAFAMKVRTMAKLAGARGSSNDLAKRFGLQSWQVDRARRDLQGWTDEGLARAIEALATADAQVKGAGRDPVYALERMVGVIASRGSGV
ncbi:DNA polymerase III subunit delta [Homoserinibacter sp. GY 40078]|uniref:DNA polymerase III subunit delta n=1 Tax=Homoserinibacter sp. GY 40078 TaxID=2603275 RepID=UPI0011CAB933|nr:DNA polymerase III subunit delta [Homoserinibacter sp. GY 40078]TXK17152.1 DNA polymerase III subunit delta [Homoserinibacter sp. GY 40078]